MMKKPTILQIMPTEGEYYQAYHDDGKVFTRPIVCWALVEEDELRYVLGMTHVAWWGLDLPTATNYLGQFRSLEEARQHYEDNRRHDLDFWRKQALRALNENGAADCEHNSRYLPSEQAELIEEELQGVTSTERVNDLFEKAVSWTGDELFLEAAND